MLVDSLYDMVRQTLQDESNVRPANDDRAESLVAALARYVDESDLGSNGGVPLVNYPEAGSTASQDERDRRTVKTLRAYDNVRRHQGR